MQQEHLPDLLIPVTPRRMADSPAPNMTIPNFLERTAVSTTYDEWWV